MDKSNVIIESQISNSATLYNRIRIVKSTIGEHTTIGDDCDIVNLQMKERTELGRRNIVRDSVLGRGSYTGTNTIIKNSDIGQFCCISWNVSIGGGMHDYHHISMYTDYWYHRNFGVTMPELDKEQQRTTIGNDVWIGAGAIINNGVTIENGCVIGAGAVVTKNIPAYSVVMCVPGTVVKKRFHDDIIELLQKMEWWNWTEEKIKENIEFLRNKPEIDRLRAYIDDEHDA